VPWINDRFYANPAYGRAVERARSAETNADEPEAGTHWVTIDGHHVLMERQHTTGGPHIKPKKASISARDKAYLDKYFEAVQALAKKYGVDPALVLGLGSESGFATRGTYLRTGDAFGMTAGGTSHMMVASSPAQNAKQFFDNYGAQIRDIGDNLPTFLNALKGLDESGNRVPGWKVYNSSHPAAWRSMVEDGVRQMKRDMPTYFAGRPKAAPR